MLNRRNFNRSLVCGGLALSLPSVSAKDNIEEQFDIKSCVKIIPYTNSDKNCRQYFIDNKKFGSGHLYVTSLGDSHYLIPNCSSYNYVGHRTIYDCIERDVINTMLVAAVHHDKTNRVLRDYKVSMKLAQEDLYTLKSAGVNATSGYLLINPDPDTCIVAVNTDIRKYGVMVDGQRHNYSLELIL